MTVHEIGGVSRKYPARAPTVEDRKRRKSVGLIGDRGRGDTPHSSDGVVPYWSSHVGGAKSEKIVPSDHGADQNPEAIAEVVRILKEHIENKGSVMKGQPRISRQGMLDVSAPR
jgi:hypothetical protein